MMPSTYDDDDNNNNNNRLKVINITIFLQLGGEASADSP
jgi:hypothetical protein